MSAIELIKRHEGLRLKPYLDTVGKLTIGYGRNLDDNGISEEESEMMLCSDVRKAKYELLSNFSWTNDISRSQMDALIDMVFNLGMPRFKGFKKMIVAFENGNYDLAANEALDSKWADQVGERAIEVAGMIRDG